MSGKAQDDDLVMNLVDLAMTKPSQDREHFLREACSGDPELFRNAWTYVEWQDRMNGFLEKPLARPFAVEHPFAAGEVLEGRFRIVREVAQGGMGIVYEAWDEKLDRRIAIKCAKTGFRKRLPPEVRHAREISHPNVCKTFEIHTAQTPAGEIDFVTMEFLDGPTLADRMQRAAPPEAEARTIAQQLAAGLAAAHSQGVVHGDLKGGNVILTQLANGAPRAVITDFGMARARESAQTAQQSGVAGGTFDYMAPELLRGERATPASDVYALGVMLHELATGRKPNDNGPQALLDSHWRSTVQKCLAQDPAHRYASGAEVAQAFAPSKTRPWFLAAAAALVIAALTGVATYQRATAPKEVYRVGVLPFEVSGDAPLTKEHAETTANLAKLSGGARARYSSIALKPADAQLTPEALAQREFTHVLRATFTKEKDQIVVHAFLTDTRNGVNIKDWKNRRHVRMSN